MAIRILGVLVLFFFGIIERSQAQPDDPCESCTIEMCYMGLFFDASPICPGTGTLVSYDHPCDVPVVGSEWSPWPGYSGDVIEVIDYTNALLGPGVYILKLYLENGCIRQLVFTIHSTEGDEPLDSQMEFDSCLGQSFNFGGVYLNPEPGNFWLYLFNNPCVWTGDNASLDIKLNGEWILTGVQGNNCQDNLWTPSFSIQPGDFIEVYYEPGDFEGNASLGLSNCSYIPTDLIMLSLSEPGLVWSGYAACPYDPLSGTWEIISGPGNVTLSDPSDVNTEITMDTVGQYELDFTTGECGNTYHYIFNVADDVPVIDIPEEEVIFCCGANANLQANVDAGDSPVTVTWMPGGQTGNNISVNLPGWYYATATTGCGSVTDSVLVIQQFAPGQGSDEGNNPWITLSGVFDVPPMPEWEPTEPGDWWLCLLDQNRMDWRWTDQECRSAITNTSEALPKFPYECFSGSDILTIEATNEWILMEATGRIIRSGKGPDTIQLPTKGIYYLQAEGYQTTRVPLF